MHPEFKPMLAASPPKHLTPDQAREAMRYPVLGTPKLDGIRAVTFPLRTPGDAEFGRDQLSTPMTRSLKHAVPNNYIRSKMSLLPPYLDGEIVATGTFQNCQSAVMGEQGEWDFKYYVFDIVPNTDLINLNGVDAFYQVTYQMRMDTLEALDLPDFCIKLIPKLIQRGELEAYERECLEAKYEGAISRSPTSPYKFGRSTFREQWMVKHKEFVDDEAVVVGYEEEMHNANEAKTNQLGYKERTSHQKNMVGKGRLGALKVRHPTFGEFHIGSGFSVGDREALWRDRERLEGRYVTFKYQPQGVKDRPRIPIFKSFRNRRDLDPGDGGKNAGSQPSLL